MNGTGIRTRSARSDVIKSGLVENRAVDQRSPAVSFPKERRTAVAARGAFRSGPSGSMSRMVEMSKVREQAAVLVLSEATAGPWQRTARVVQAARGALRLVDGDLTGLDEDDHAHAAEVVARLRGGDLARAEALIAAARAEGAHLVTVLDEEYPGNLDFVHDLPPVLWVRGLLLDEDHRSIAVVGEHSADGPSIDRVRHEVRALAQAGLTLVADLRPGIGPVAHATALAAGGRTIATLAQGITVPVAPENTTLAKEIAHGGALVSPFRPLEATTPRTVSLSRTVTSGLAAAVYIVDGEEDGGAARQARTALSQGRRLFVPHRLHEEQPWVRRVAHRGGITVVRDIDDLLTQVVNLVDVTRHLQSF
ncbi:DNA-processing protein DprA [Streptosporangium sp. NPDC004379]|uniref:DNA-processing protein DprA n=1 Tax=Streptosporangium sp. NPDC004379 TaxID=3366189 RepID=UPI0036BA5E40